MVVKDTVRVITNNTEILRRVEEDTGGALVVAAPLLVGVPSHVGLAVAEATPIDSNRVVLCFGRVWLENGKGHSIRLFVLG